MIPVKSWDVFDTLIARTVPHPTDIFSIVESEHPYLSFKSNRIEAERRSNGTIGDIYLQFRLLTGISEEYANALRQRELQTEMNHTIPIMTNVNQLEETDILVSDMYLTESEIAALLAHHGITTYKKLYVYNGGKHTGFAWETLIKEYNILQHTGDNMHSDIIMASRYSIRGIYTDAHKFTQLENTLYTKNPALGRLLRTFRLSNPYRETSIEYKLFNEQITYNIPLLLFMCYKIADTMEKESRTTVLFLTRDGCLIIKLFTLLYPQFIAIPFHSSRIMNRNYNKDYVEYIRSVYNKDSCILFDLNGSFTTARPLFQEHFKHLPRVLLFQYDNTTPLYDGLSYIMKSFGDSIECLNTDLVGTLVNFIGTKEIRMPSEYVRSFISINHKTVDSFCSYIMSSNLLSDCRTSDSQVLVSCCESLRSARMVLKNVSEVSTLTQLANKYNSDKGNTYRCAHHYTIKYEEIIHTIVNIMGIEKPRILEIGLNNTKSIPSLMIWQDYFHKKVEITGFDIQRDFLKFNGSVDNIRIFVGDQSNIVDLQQLKDTCYHLLIDDGYHASKHQQISFKTLWDSVEPGGFYIIEDLQWQPEKESCIKTRTLFEQWLVGNYISTEYITAEEVAVIIKSIHSIEFYDTRSKLWPDPKHAFVSIRKK